jgi:hypothetical protein
VKYRFERCLPRLGQYSPAQTASRQTAGNPQLRNGSSCFAPGFVYSRTVDAAKCAPLKKRNVRNVMSLLVGVSRGKKYSATKIGIVMAPPTRE